MNEPASLTYDLPHKSEHCSGGWAQHISGRGLNWRCAECGAVCYDAPGVLEAIRTERAMGEALVRLARAGEELKGEDWPPEGWDR